MGAAPSHVVTLEIGQPLPRAPEHGSCIYLDYQATTPVTHLRRSHSYMYMFIVQYDLFLVKARLRSRKKIRGAWAAHPRVI